MTMWRCAASALLRRRSFGWVVIAAMVVAIPLPTRVAAEPATLIVDIVRFAFVPNDVTVAPGTRVRWVNHDETPHTVTSQGAARTLRSPGMDVDDHFDFVFDDEGDFAYFCTVHPMMNGVVHVHGAAKAR